MDIPPELRSRKGFTLIELLVVIAIIGILASIILASLASARGKGSDATVKSDMQGIATQLELVTVGSNYSNSCSDPNIIKALNSIVKAGPATSYTTAIATADSGTVVACHSSSSGWAVEAPLQGGTNNWCIDGSGSASSTTNVLGTSGSAAVTCT